MAIDVGSLFSAKIGPVPVWMIVGAGGIGLALFAPKLLSKFTGGGNSAQGGPTDNTGTPGVSNNLPDTIDPITGIPYAVEEAIDPNTGLPVYMDLYYGTGISTPPSPNPTPTPPPAAPFPQPGGTGAGSGSVPPGGVPPGIPPAAPFGQGVAGAGVSGPPVAGGVVSQTGVVMSPGNGPGVPPAAPFGQGGATPVPPVSPYPQGGGATPVPPASPYPQGRVVNPLPWPSPQSTLSGIASAQGIPLSRLEQLNGWILQQRGSYNLIYPTDKIRVA